MQTMTEAQIEANNQRNDFLRKEVTDPGHREEIAMLRRYLERNDRTPAGEQIARDRLADLTA